ncbi:curculin-like (mannose-binding) lectin family protein / PAN domain-containing protein [Wolffia australiana]
MLFSGLVWVVVFFLPTLLHSADSLIPLGSKLAVGETTRWVSPSGRFAVGFFNLSDQPYRFGVGVLFLSPAIPIVVWAAGAGESVSGGSYLLLSDVGELVLFDSSRGAIAWTSNTSLSSVVSGDLLDDGNLVLLGENRAVLWQSFDTPSDTLVPGQKLASGQTLRAAGQSSVASYYALSVEPAKGMALSWEDNVTYWKTESPAAASPPLSAFFSGDGTLQLLDRNLNPVWTVFGNDHGEKTASFRFVRLDVDGNLRMYSLDSVSGYRTVVWQAVQNQCKVFATCGLHGLCFFDGSGAASCKCPFGVKPGSSSSCVAPYKTSCGHGTTIVTLQHTSLYGVYPPEEASSVMSVDDCRSSCLRDLSCSSATWTNDGEARCLTKKTPFISGYEDASLPSVSFVKLCLDPFAVVLPDNQPEPPSSATRGDARRTSKHRRRLAAAGAAVFIVLLLVQIVLGVRFARWRKKRKKAEEASRASIKLRMGSGGIIPLTLTEVKALTGDFKHRLGPSSYRGVLPSEKAVVVRELTGADPRQFQRWVAVLGSVHHRNLAKLEAFCGKSDQKECFLAYEFARNGSVERWRVHPRLSRRLTWERRMEICRGVARALAYLHSDCREFICHGKLSWSNVVLDGDFHAKVTDYGLAKLAGEGGSAEEDVARFGEMVAVLVTGSDLSSAYGKWRSEAAYEEVLDPAMARRAEPQQVERALRIAFWCAHPDHRLRPAMAEVAKVLDGTLPVDPPPPPPLPLPLTENPPLPLPRLRIPPPPAKADSCDDRSKAWSTPTTKTRITRLVTWRFVVRSEA